MKCLVVGKKKVSFTDPKTDKMINVASLSVIHNAPPSSDSTTYEGKMVSVVSIPFEYIDSVFVDDELLLDFDRNGKLLEMEKLSSSAKSK